MSDENNEGIVMPAVASDPVTEEVKQSEVTAESSPASEENHEEKTNGVQKRINDLTAKRYQAERERDELRAQLEKQAQTTIEQPQPQIDAPALPDDIYDEEAMRKYHAETLAYNTKVAQESAKAQFEEQQKQKSIQQQQAQQQKTTESYVNNAIRDGVDLDKLKTVEQTLVQGGIKPELGQYIMADANGAKIAEYLADNQAEMYDILAMDPVSAGIKIATEIKPKVLSSTPKVSGAPDPIPDVKGGGYVEIDDFDKNFPGAEFI